MSVECVNNIPTIAGFPEFLWKDTEESLHEGQLSSYKC
jgi:hypothetical protein